MKTTTKITKIIALALVCNLQFSINNLKAQTVWNTGSLTFTKTAAGQEDAITASTHLTRTTVLFNSVCQTISGNQGCTYPGPCNTEWAYGSIANYSSLTYTSWINMNGCNPPSMVGQTTVCHIISENIYFQVTWNSWTPASSNFSYTRTTGPCTPVNWYLDADGDGHYLGSAISACTSPGAGYNTTATTPGDCDDNNNSAYQNASLFVDLDEDGYDNGSAIVCYGTTPPAGYSLTSDGTDCDDTNPFIYISGTVYSDNDGDGYDSGNAVLCYGNTLPAGYSLTTMGTDCNDNDNMVYQSATLFIDSDGDGYDVGTSSVCYGATIPTGFALTTLGSDCNDADNMVYTSSLLYLDTDGDGYDGGGQTFCYGATLPAGYITTTLGTDCDDNTNSMTYLEGIFFIDADGDGYDNGSETICYGLTTPAGHSTTTLGTDCDDADNMVYQSATLFIDADGDNYDGGTAVVCYGATIPAGYNTNSFDPDCDESTASLYMSAILYIDNDGDGYDAGTATVCIGATIPTGYVANSLGTDCNDNNNALTTVCTSTWYLDFDGDGYGAGMQTAASSPGAGWSNTAPANGSTDCDDNDNMTYQSGSLFVDADGDGYDMGSATVCYGATTPTGYSMTTNGTDCDDTNNMTYQSGSFFVDADGDGYDAGTATVCYGATTPTGYSMSTSGTDCDDNNNAVFTGPVGTATNTIICSGGNTGIALSSNITGTTFTWTSSVISGSVVGNGNCSSLCGTGITDILTDVGGGNGVVEYTVTPSVGTCAGSAFTVTAGLGTVPSAPVVSGLTAICGVINPSFSATSNFASTYTWTVPTGLTITSGQGTASITAHQASFNVPGNMTVTASNGCGTSTITTVLITKKPGAPGIINGPISTCAQSTATWNIAPVAGATGYVWTVPTGMTITSGAGTTQISVSIASTFIIGNVKVAAVNACGSVPGTVLSVTGNVPPAPIYIYGSANVCGMSSTTFSCSVTAAYGATGYAWTVPAWMTITSGQGTSMIAVNIISAPVAGNSVTVSGTNVCGTGTARVLVMSTAAIQPASLSGPSNTCGITSATYTCSSVAGAVSYQWTPAIGQTILTGQGTTMITVSILPTSTTTTAGSYLKVVSVNACGVNSPVKQIVITRCLSPDAMDNGAEEEREISIYPNPCASQLGIRNYELGIGVVEMYDVLGERVKQLTIDNGQLTMDIDDLSRGIYFVRIVSEGRVVYSEKVIKQ